MANKKTVEEMLEAIPRYDGSEFDLAARMRAVNLVLTANGCTRVNVDPEFASFVDRVKAQIKALYKKSK